MIVEEILCALRERNAVLYVEGDRLKYRGLKRAPDDPIRAAIQEHRSELIALFSVPLPATRPAGWSDRLQRVTLESVAGHPDQWQEPAASTALCIWCSDPLAEGDPIACTAHRARLSVTPFTPQASVAVTSAPVLSRDDLLAIAELRGWEALPFRPGERAGGSEEAWRTFAGWMRGPVLRQAVTAVWERWGDTVEQYAWMHAAAAPGAQEAAA